MGMPVQRPWGVAICGQGGDIERKGLFPGCGESGNLAPTESPPPWERRAHPQRLHNLPLAYISSCKLSIHS
jgi:hypothetical protein